MCEEFLVSFLYSVCSKCSLVENVCWVNVKSSLSDMAKKYGMLKEDPSFCELENCGIKKPDRLLTVGSG